ncbi:MAG: hypothetical protein NC223_05885 [Butyrivibrio sp.]|nr:hypothetical protein [Butyrivibrio sp.]
MTIRIKIRQIMTMFLLIITLTFATNVYAMDMEGDIPTNVRTSIFECIDDIAQSELFCDWMDADVFINDIYSYTQNNLKVYKLDIMKNGQQLGYVLSDELGNILSYSRNSEPEEFMKDYCNIYTGAESDDYDLASESVCSYSEVQTYSSPYMVIDGVSPQLQGDSNCIVAAASNVIWYYGNNGKYSLIKNYTFNDVKTSMMNCYKYNGGDRNDTTPKAIEIYIYAKGLENVYNSNVQLYRNSSATKELMISEINEKKPMMLGFAAGSIYSDTVGHMTMCYGYQVTGGNTYAYVASGHQSYGTFVKWDDTINDCIITIRIY